MLGVSILIWLGGIGMQHKKKVLSVLFVLMIVAVPLAISGVSSVHAQGSVIFADDFEYDDSLENHGWTIDVGSPVTAVDPENAGNRMAYLLSVGGTGGTKQFSHSFNELPLQPGMQLSTRFYDTGDSCNNCDVTISVEFNANIEEIHVGWYNNPSSFTYDHDFSGSWSGHLYEPYGLRGVGWHTFLWRVEQNGGIDLLIDGNLILDDLMGPGGSPVATLSQVRIAIGGDASTYSFSVDDFSMTGPAQTVCLQVDGEGLTDGAPIPGWNLVFGGPPAVATVTATSNPAGIHSGSRGVKVNGDFTAGKEFDIVAKGIVTVDYWHYPRPGTSTNSGFALHGGEYTGTYDVGYWQYVNVWKNDQDLWWVAGEEVPTPTIATYSGQYTHIVITIDTDTGLFDVNIDEQLVYQGTVANADKIAASGIRYVATSSGRGAVGTDSYLDDIVITSTATTPTPSPTPTPDTTPPEDVTNLSVSDVSTTTVTLNWTAPGDDGNTGTASQYDIRMSTSLITDANWGSAIPLVPAPSPNPAGSVEAVQVTQLTEGTTYYFALKTADEVPNPSGLSNIVTATPTNTNTPAGPDVQVDLGTVEATFDNVDTEGVTYTSTTMVNQCGALPSGYQVIGLYTDVSTTATFDPGVTVGIRYAEVPNMDETTLRLFHCESGQWVDRTTSVDTANNIVYGQVDSFSWFFIGGQWVWVPGATSAPVFPSIYIGIAAALGAAAIAYFARRRLIRQE